ncbi:hypothetical protein JW752_00545 [Candidatus Peregrinibacteria bacterium]|nr:hypothetical protein [Candidatus Peregrinibacteria bacterium]
MSPLLEGETLEGCASENFVDCTAEEVSGLAELLSDMEVKREGDYIHFSVESLGVDLTLLVSPATGRLFLFEAREGNPKQLLEQIKAMKDWKAMGLRPDLYHNDAPDDVKMIEKSTEWFREQLIHFFNTYSGSPKIIHVVIDDNDGAELDGKVDPNKLV